MTTEQSTPDRRGSRRRQDRTPLRLDRRRIYMVPSRAGLGWAALLATMFFGALNYMNNAALLLTCELAASMALTMLLSFRNLYRLELQSVSCRQAVAGEPAMLRVQLASSGRRHRRLQLDAGLQPSAWFGLAANVQPEPISLPARFPSRGWHALPPLQLRTRWPLGLFTAWARLRLTDKILVWPAAESAGPPLPLQACHHQASLPRHRPTQSPDMLRKYRPGDPSTHIAWKLLARSGEWHAKTSPASRLPDQLALHWSRTEGLPHEARIARLAHWLRLARQSGLAYSLELPTLNLPAGRDDRHYASCMDALARLP